MFVHDAEFLNISCVCVRWWSKWLGVCNLSCGSRRAAIFLLWHVESPRAARPPPPSLSWGYLIILRCSFPGAFALQLDGFLESPWAAQVPNLSLCYLIIFKCSFPGAYLWQLDGFLESLQEARPPGLSWGYLIIFKCSFPVWNPGPFLLQLDGFLEPPWEALNHSSLSMANIVVILMQLKLLLWNHQNKTRGQPLLERNALKKLNVWVQEYCRSDLQSVKKIR